LTTPLDTSNLAGVSALERLNSLKGKEHRVQGNSWYIATYGGKGTHQAFTEGREN